MDSISRHDRINKPCFVRRVPAVLNLPRTEKILLTYEEVTNIKDFILNAIEEAQRAIKICSFFITDKEVLEAIQKKMLNNDVKISILTHLNKTIIEQYQQPEEELINKTGKWHIGILCKLVEAGVHVRAASDIHAKFMVVDGCKSLITSANFTERSLNLLPESGVIVDDERSKELEAIFDLIFEKGAPYRDFLNDVNSSEHLQEDCIANLDEAFLPIGSSGFSYTYKRQKNKLLSDIAAIAGGSTSELYVNSYLIKQLYEIPSFVNALQTTLDRGNNIKVFTRAVNHREDHLKACNELREMGCEVHGDVFNHIKGIVSKDSAIMFTANIDGEYGLNNGFEIGTILREQEREELFELSEYLFSTAPFVFEKQPTFEQVFNYFNITYAAKQLTNELVFDDLLLVCDKEGVFNPDKLLEHFLYGIVDDTGLLGVEIGGELFAATIQIETNVLTIHSKVESLSSAVKFIIDFNTITIKHG